MKTRRVTVAIHDLGCGGGGSLTIERALAHLEGVIQAYVNPATEMAYVEYDPALTSPAALVTTIEDLGFGTGQPRQR